MFHCAVTLCFSKRMPKIITYCVWEDTNILQLCSCDFRGSSQLFLFLNSSFQTLYLLILYIHFFINVLVSVFTG